MFTRIGKRQLVIFVMVRRSDPSHWASGIPKSILFAHIAAIAIIHLPWMSIQKTSSCSVQFQEICSRGLKGWVQNMPPLSNQLQPFQRLRWWLQHCFKAGLGEPVKSSASCKENKGRDRDDDPAETEAEGWGWIIIMNHRRRSHHHHPSPPIVAVHTQQREDAFLHVSTFQSKF